MFAALPDFAGSPERGGRCRQESLAALCRLWEFAGENKAVAEAGARFGLTVSQDS